MPKARLPDYFNEYKVICKGVGESIDQAEYNLVLDISYRKRWIKGKLVQETQPEANRFSDGSYSITVELTYKKNLDR